MCTLGQEKGRRNEVLLGLLEKQEIQLAGRRKYFKASE
jgi:hypothetical protein